MSATRALARTIAPDVTDDPPPRPLAVRSLTVVEGRDKEGLPGRGRLTIERGQVVCVVGPTGSGKSRLLADIECLAQGDTPTGRRILIDGTAPDEAERAAYAGRLVAQLSQTMNFVMDLTVDEFLAMHAECREIPAPDTVATSVLRCANELAGEPFGGHAALTQLSGGQSRALMISDAALLSTSPVVLIDEIENAGIDRRKALGLLVSKDKIVLLSTHDPMLALLGDRRVVIRRGAVDRVLETSPGEREALRTLEHWDKATAQVRSRLREGDSLDIPAELREANE